MYTQQLSKTQAIVLATEILACLPELATINKDILTIVQLSTQTMLLLSLLEVVKENEAGKRRVKY